MLQCEEIKENIFIKSEESEIKLAENMSVLLETNLTK